MARGKRANRAEREVGVLTQLRASEKRTIVTVTLLVLLLGCLSFQLLVLFEIWFHQDDEFLLVRCVAYKAGMFEADQSYTKYLIAILGLAVSALADDVGRVWSWRIAVVVALIGLAVSVILAVTFDPLTAVNEPAVESIAYYCPTAEVIQSPVWVELEPSQDKPFEFHLATGLKQLCTTLAAWYGSVAAGLLAINIDNIERVAAKFSRGAGG